MFEKFYELNTTPFTRNIPAHDLFATEQQQEILARLQYTAERQWFALLTGDCGSGKSTLIRKYTEELNHKGYKILYLSDSKLTPRHFYNGLLEQLGAQGCFYRGDSKRLLHREIELMQNLQQIKPVVIIDEAHLLDREMLEEIRFLLNYKIDSVSPMALILVGQSELLDKFRRQIYTAVAQRVNLKFHMTYLDESQTKAYILHGLRYAGAASDIFSDNAVAEIFRYSFGSPRLINKACTHCLMYGAQRQKKIIDDSVVRHVVENELL